MNQSKQSNWVLCLQLPPTTHHFVHKSGEWSQKFSATKGGATTWVPFIRLQVRQHNNRSYPLFFKAPTAHLHSGQPVPTPIAPH